LKYADDCDNLKVVAGCAIPTERTILTVHICFRLLKPADTVVLCRSIQVATREMMPTNNLKLHICLTVSSVMFVCLCVKRTTRQIVEDPNTPEMQLNGTPGQITDLVDQIELTQEQVDQMRKGGTDNGK